MRHAEVMYTDTTSTAVVADYLEHLHLDRKRKHKWRRCRHFLMQRLTGVILLALTVLAAMWQDGDVTIGIITVPLGLYLMITRKILIGMDPVGK